MPRITIPPNDFILHPEGRYSGRIFELEDRGMIETQYGTKHKMVVKIECDSAVMDDGTKYMIGKWYTVSSHPKAGLTQLREMLLGRKLSEEEARGLESDELRGRRIGYLVKHTEGREGGTFANIDNLWPLEDMVNTEDTENTLPF